MTLRNMMRQQTPSNFGTSGCEEAPIEFSDSAEIAASIHGSLLLDEILLGCFRLLNRHFSLRRLSLAQQRKNENAATLYSLDDDSDTPFIVPTVIALEESRLRDCLIQRQSAEARFSSGSEPDCLEQTYLIRAGTSAVIYAPLLLGEKLKGVLVIAHGRKEPLTLSQSKLLTPLTSQLSLAIENSDIHYYERRRGRQLHLVSEIAKQAVMLEDLSEFVKKASQLLRQGFDYDAVQIWSVGSRQELLLKGYAYKLPPTTFQGNGLPQIVAECRQRNEIICNNRVSTEAQKSAGHPHAASQLAAPIRLRGKLLGVLSIESSRLDAFSAEDFSVLEGMTSLIASAFDNLRMFEHSQQSNEYMQALLESARDRAILSTDLHGHVITSSAGSHAIFKLSQQEILGRDILTLFSDRRFQRELAAYIKTPEIPTLERAKLSQITGESPSYLDVIAQRVHDAENLPIGFLFIIRDMTERIHLQQSLENLSFTDELTGFYNQRRFFVDLTEEIERSRRYRRPFSLCFFDLDGFKKYNDTGGHLRGDKALKETAGFLRTMVRGFVDTCYRYGGDEFTIIMPETSRRNAQIVVERIRRMLHEHFQGKISASIGVAEFEESMKAEDIVEKADRAMYTAKNQGGNCVVIAD